MNQFSNGLTPKEAERLAILIEEMGETIQIVGKILRHGANSHHPDNPQESNVQMLERELGDVVAATEMLSNEQFVSKDNITQRAKDKLKRIVKWLHFP